MILLAISHKSNLKSHMAIHASKKDWVCDCCGSRFGLKVLLKGHMLNHLPPSFACSKCDRKFVFPGDLKNHLKRHAGILNEICKTCNKGYSTKGPLRMHIINKHFSKIQCKIPNCAYKTGVKGHYKSHLKRQHKKLIPNLIGKLLEELEKLKPDYQKMKYV